jgi:hypothetical protein
MRSAGTVTTSGTEGAVLFDMRSSRGLSILQTDDGHVRVYAYAQNNSTPVNTITSSATVSDNQWHLITVDFTQGSGSACSLYIDGVLDNQGNNTAAWNWTQTQAMALGQSISGTYSKNWRKYNGLLDDVRFYNATLTAAQITSIYKGADEAVVSSDVNLNVQSQMYNVNASTFIRVPFNVTDPNVFTSLLLTVRNNDGFVAWINGVQVASENAPTSLAWNSAATDVHSPGRSRIVTITVTSGMLRAGTNILAIQGLNNSVSDPNFLIIPQLDGILSSSTTQMYFATPTPGAANSAGKTDLGPFITNVTNSVERPAGGSSSQPLTITAHVSQSLRPVASVQLAWRIMFNSETLVTMYDDGPSGGHGDAVAGDLTYTTLIPTTSLTAGQMLRWRVIATDTSSIQSTGPAYLDPTDSDQYYGTVALDSVSTQLPIYYFFVDGYQTPTSTSNETTVDTDAGARGDFFYNNELYDNVLITIKGYTTRYLFKRSHRVDFNDDHQFLLEEGDQRRGSIAFDAEYVDPSYIRQYLSMWLFNASGTPAPVDFPVRLQMNGDFWQLAFVTEPLGKSLLKRLGLDPDDAMYSMVGQFKTSYYSSMAKETRTWDTSWADYDTVAAAISSSNTVTQLSQALFDYFDIPEVINYIAMARITQQNDDVWANMAIYCDTDGDGLWRIMPYDLNLSFGQLYYGDHTSTNGVIVATDDYNKSHPLYGSSACLSYGTSNYNMLYNAIIQVPETREMLLRRERTLMDQFLQAPGTPYGSRVIEAKIDQVVALIQQEANMDRAKWGWPPIGGPYGLGNVPFSQGISDIKTLFLDPARTHLYVTHSIDNTSKTIGIGNANNAGIPDAQNIASLINITEVDAVPISGDQDEEYIKLTNPNATSVDISVWTLSGGIDFTFQQGTVIPAGGSLYVSPNTKAFRSRATGPTGGESLFVVGPYDGHISALGETIQLKNSAGTVVSSYVVPNTASTAQSYLRITEINYHPLDPPIGSSYTQDDFEFIELYNTSSTVTVDLTEVHFSSDPTDGTGIDFDFSNSSATSLAPGQYIVLAKNPTALATRYNLTGVTVVGPYTGVLSNSADTIRLFDAVNEKINEIHYQDSDPWPGRADGKGFTLEIINPLGNDNDPSNWRSSTEYQGTPGHAGMGTINGVVVNEVLTHDDYPLYDSIELYNTTSVAVNISGWYLSDSSDDYKKYRFPDGTVLAPYEYRVFTEEQFGISMFSGATQPGDGDAQTQDSGATLYLTGSTWRKLALPYTVTTNTVLEFDYMSTKEGNIQGIGLDEDNSASSNRLFELYGTTTWGITNYANYSGSTWKHYVIPVGSFYTGSMAYLVFANGDTANLANSYFRNVKVYESTAGSAINFDKYFSLSSTGDDVWLMEADALGNLTYFVDHVSFGAAINGESFGRWPNATGNLYPMQNRTLGQANDAGGNGPRIGPLLISEVMYHPNVSADQNPDDYEYVEICNPTAATVDLSNWQISSGVDFEFASGTTIGAHQALLVLPFDPSDPLNDIMLANFKSEYNVGSSVILVGGFKGHLANEGETVQLLRADGVLEDEINYDNASPWPTAAAGGGDSLQRVSAAAWGDDAASWIAAAPTPGTAQVSALMGRNIFYNNYKFDAHAGYPNGDPAANVYDDNAIATDKQALLPGYTATFANYTSYSRGINGIMVDILYPENPGGINAADFQFQVGNGGTWTNAPAPNNVLVRQGKGVDGSDRVTITWDDNIIQNQWLQVTVLADANTGLSAPDVFYFGNAIGESGDSPANAVVDSHDEIGSRTHKTGFTAAAITNPYDYNRDGKVNATDDLIARHNRTDGVGDHPLQLIAAPVGAPPASGDALQPLSVVVEIASSQPATSSADIASSQSVALLAADIATSQPAALLEDKAISQPAPTAVEITTSQPVPLSPAAAIVTSWAEMSPVAVEIVPEVAEIMPAPAVTMPAQSPFTSFPRSSVAVQFPGVLHPQDMVGNSNLFNSSRDAGASDQWIPMLGHGNRTSRPASSQDSLHDAVFERSIARFSLTEEDGLPDDSSAPADIETFFKDCLPLKSGKSFAHAIDALLAAPRHKKD